MRQRHAAPLRFLALPLAAGLVLGLLGPFGTHGALPPSWRLGYWLALVPLNWLICDAAIRVAAGVLPARWPPVAAPVLGALAAAVPATGVAFGANRLAGMAGPPLSVLAGYVALVCLVLALLVHGLSRRDAPVAPDRAPTQAAPTRAAPAEAEQGGSAGASTGVTASFAARLDGGPPGRLLCIETQDHYLLVHGEGGRRLVLCRMDDAARELAGAGRRVHRSWWVADWAVRAVERDGTRTMLRLVDGRRVPVGRTFREAVAPWRAGAPPR